MWSAVCTACVCSFLCLRMKMWRYLSLTWVPGLSELLSARYIIDIPHFHFIPRNINFIFSVYVRNIPSPCMQALATLTYPGYVWITPGWFTDGWWLEGVGEEDLITEHVCSGEQLAQYLDGSLSVSHYPRLQEKASGDPGTSNKSLCLKVYTNQKSRT